MAKTHDEWLEEQDRDRFRLEQAREQIESQQQLLDEIVVAFGSQGLMRSELPQHARQARERIAELDKLITEQVAVINALRAEVARLKEWLRMARQTIDELKN